MKTTTTTTTTGLKVKSAIKAGGFGGIGNHNRTGLKVKSAIKAGSGLGSLVANHNGRVLQ